jgi:uncharacterized glyoxalase superfamily protein PhnB
MKSKIKIQKLSTVLIWSENFRKLANWYQEIFGFEVVEELDHPQDTGVLFKIGSDSPWLWIGQHSQVKGKNADPCRHMFNLNVESVSETYLALKEKGVGFVAEPFKAPTFDKYFATFTDLDGNLIQLIGNE